MGRIRNSVLGLALAALLGAGCAQAATVTTQLAFTGDNGAAPSNGELLFANGTFYGSTFGGGADDLGVVYSTSGAVIHSFSGLEGIHPNGNLAADASGNIYGTTAAGGSGGAGTVFKLTRPAASSGTWGITLLHVFAGPGDGAFPTTGPSIGPDGTLYGTASEGGNMDAAICAANNRDNTSTVVGCGTVWKISHAGSFSVVHTFTGTHSDSWRPSGNLIIDSQVNILGTTTGPIDESADGFLYKITAAGVYSNVVTFQGRGLAGSVFGSIARDSAGNVYGLAGNSGSLYFPTGQAVFKVSAVTHLLTILAAVGPEIIAGGPTLDKAGNLYFTTRGETRSLTTGAISRAVPAGLFVIPHGTSSKTQLVAFTNDNLSPVGGVTPDSLGNLWGQTTFGGTDCFTSSSVVWTGCGTVYAVSP